MSHIVGQTENRQRTGMCGKISTHWGASRMRLVPWLLAMFIASAALGIGSLVAIVAGPGLTGLLYILVIVALIGFVGSGALLIIATWRH
jgi:hypothetical protein